MTNTDHPRLDHEQAWYEDILGRGTGDPDTTSYPGDPVTRSDSVLVVWMPGNDFPFPPLGVEEAAS